MYSTLVTDIEEANKFDFYIGLSLAISSSIFIGSSFIIKKISLRHLAKDGLRASAGGFGYLKDWTWWLGLLTMGVGEMANFGAYAFAPASIVTPLGALSILVSAVMASRFLHETMSSHGKSGCILCILGSVVIVTNGPHEGGDFESIDELLTKITAPDFLYYVFLVSVIAISIAFVVGPRYGSKHVTVYMALCSTIGSLTVMSCKALGLALRSAISGELPHKDVWIVVVLFFAVILFIAVQVNYLNKALDVFDTSVVTPVYYVMFTTMVIVVSAILFREWANMEPGNILGAVCGFGIIVVAIFLLSGSHKSNVQNNLHTYIGREYGSNSGYPRTI